MAKKSIKVLKAEYLRFYADLPVQKAAADFIGRDEDTIINWRKSDKAFADDVSRAKSEWARKNHRRMRPDILLARLYDDLKPVPQEVDLTTHDVKQPGAVNNIFAALGFERTAGASDSRAESQRPARVD